MNFTRVVDQDGHAHLVNLDRIVEVRVSEYSGMSELVVESGQYVVSNKPLAYWEEILVLIPASAAAREVNWKA